MVERIISGGQTGVDRAALDAALATGIACGGWCPMGRRAEDGPIPERYPLSETSGRAYIERTRRNVEESDATLVVTRGTPTGGTRRTIEFAGRIGRPVFLADLRAGATEPAMREEIVLWIAAKDVRVLNVAGPRESTRPGIHRAAGAFLGPLFAMLAGDADRPDGRDAGPIPA